MTTTPKNINILKTFWTGLCLLTTLMNISPVNSQAGVQTCATETILTNCKVYTVDSSNTVAEALAFDASGKIVAVGTAADVAAAYPSYTSIDLGGQLVIPGFHDVHLHAVEAGINSQLCTFDAATTISDIPGILQAGCNGCMFGGNGWIMGAGLDLVDIAAQLDAGSQTPLAVLDAAYPNTPVLILDAVGHGAIVNTAALNEVGWANLAVDFPGGQVLKDSNNNNIGIVTENAQQIFRDRAFPSTCINNQEIAYQSLINALNTLKQFGITSVSDAGGFYRQAQIDAWQRAEDCGLLTVRASNALYVYPDTTIADQLSEFTSRFSNAQNSRLRWNQAKIYLDGILSLATGLLTTDYLYDPLANYRPAAFTSTTGLQYFTDAATVNEIAQSLVNAGFQLHFHVTGNAGATLALDAIESTNSGSSVQPHRLTHCFLIDAADFSRFSSLNVVADFQLAPSTLTAENVALIEGLIGTGYTYLPSLDVFNAGATVTLSSDWDADELNPLVKIQTALTRTDGQAFPDVPTVIRMMTQNAANALQIGHIVGSIEVGKEADLAVIDQDIFNLAVDQISSASVTRTYFQGKLIYDADDPCTFTTAASLLNSLRNVIFGPFTRFFSSYGHFWK